MVELLDWETDEVVEDVVDKIFGSSVHGDVNEYLNNCAESRVELQVSRSLFFRFHLV